MNAKVLEQFHSAPLRESEQVLACCIIAREKLEVGDYDDAIRRADRALALKVSQDDPDANDDPF